MRWLSRHPAWLHRFFRWTAAHTRLLQRVCKWIGRKLKFLRFINPFCYIERIDWYIIKKFISTYVLSIALIISISIVFDINENLASLRNTMPRCMLLCLIIISTSSPTLPISSVHCSYSSRSSSLLLRWQETPRSSLCWPQASPLRDCCGRT